MNNDVYVYYTESTTPPEIKNKVLLAQQNNGNYSLQNVNLNMQMDNNFVSSNNDIFTKSVALQNVSIFPTQMIFKVILSTLSEPLGIIFDSVDIANAINGSRVLRQGTGIFNYTAEFSTYNGSSTQKVPRMINISTSKKLEKDDVFAISGVIKTISSSSNHKMSYNYKFDVYTSGNGYNQSIKNIYKDLVL